MYAELVTDSLTEYTYAADLAGLAYNFTPHTTGIWAAASGYSDKISVLVHHVLDKIKTLEVNEQRLEVMKESVSHSF